MAHAVADYADYVFLTSDNPRGENPQSIIDSVSGYFDEKKVPYTVKLTEEKLSIPPLICYNIMIHLYCAARDTRTIRC